MYSCLTYGNEVLLESGLEIGGNDYDEIIEIDPVTGQKIDPKTGTVIDNSEAIKLEAKKIESQKTNEQLKWLAHCVRMENDALQKISLFMIPSKKYYKTVWTRLEKKIGLTKSDFIRKAVDKPSFNRYIELRYGSFDE